MKLVFQDIKIGDVCQVGDGAHSTIKREDSGVLYLSSRNFKDGQLDLSKVFYISEENFAKHFKERSNALTKTRPGDVALSIIGSIGEPYVVKSTDRFGLSSAVAFMRPDPAIIDSDYLYYWLKSPEFQQAIYAVKGGVAQGYVSLEMMRGLPFRIFQLDVQKDLSKQLKAYDNLIENNNRRIAILEDMAQSLYHEWFAKFRFPGHENVKFKDSSLGMIPEEWYSGTVGDLYTVKSGFAFKGKQMVDESSGYAVVKIKNINEAGLDVENIQHINEEHVGDKALRFKLKESDTLIAMTGAQVGKVSFVPKTNKPLLLNQRVGLFSKKHDWLGFTFLWQVVKSDYFQTEVTNRAQGAAQPNISATDLQGIATIIPSQKLIEDCEKICDPMYDEVRLLQNKNSILKRQRDLLLPKLISGKINGF